MSAMRAVRDRISPSMQTQPFFESAANPDARSGAAERPAGQLQWRALLARAVAPAGGTPFPLAGFPHPERLRAHPSPGSS